MRPGDGACFCPECGVRCQGLYAGCPEVWERGPRTVNTAVMTVDAPRVNLGLSAGAGAGEKARPASAATGARLALDAGSSPERPGGAGTALQTADSRVVEVPEQPDTWGMGRPEGPSSRAGVPEGHQGGGPMPADEHLDALLDREGGAAPRRGAGGATAAGEMADSDPRTHVLRWMEKRFDGLRAEVAVLASSASRQQETLELLVDRQAELEARVEQEAEQADEHELENPVADLARIAGDELGQLVDEVVTALQEAREAITSSVAAQNENTERLRLLQAAVTRQLRTMTASIGEWEKRSEDRAAAHGRRVEALAKRVLERPGETGAATSKVGGTVKATAVAKGVSRRGRAPRH